MINLFNIGQQEKGNLLKNGKSPVFCEEETSSCIFWSILIKH